MAPPIHSSALDGGEWLTPRPGRFTFEDEPQCRLKRSLSGSQRQTAGV